MVRRDQIDCTATAELGQEQEREDRGSGCAGQWPRDPVGEMKEVHQGWNQGQSRDQEATFDIETYQA